MDKLRILFLEDNVFDYELICRHLNRSGVTFEAFHVTTREDYIRALDEFQPDIILSDHRLPQFDSISALEIAQKKRPLTPFVLVTGSVSEEFAATCIKKGAFDYVLKDNMIRLSNAVNTAIERKYLVDENTSIKTLVTELAAAHKVIAEKNKDIVDSINYASKIQNAILPDIQLLQTSFPESFVLFMPKDIIGGDFYWYAHKDDVFYIAVGDCTGHGVPGCMLSMIGHNLLNSVIHVEGITDPSEILMVVNNDMMDVLNNRNLKNNPLRDGMDMGIVAINTVKQKVVFSSARRPLYTVRNGAIESINGTPVSIGEKYIVNRLFESHEFSLDKYDQLYLTSDGYADQFGGERNKKITTRKFRELLLDSTPLSGESQKNNLEEYLSKWQLSQEQTDDILVLGLNLRHVNFKNTSTEKSDFRNMKSRNKQSVIG